MARGAAFVIFVSIVTTRMTAEAVGATTVRALQVARFFALCRPDCGIAFRFDLGAIFSRRLHTLPMARGAAFVI